jgi:D-glycero-beta-D-manno-heptose-7-phosphate kinase
MQTRAYEYGITDPHTSILVMVSEFSAFKSQLRAALPRLQNLMNRFSQASILAVGDITVDEFLTGQVERISREAPVLIIRHEQTRQVPGGGANAVYNLATLGAQIKAVGLVGQDQQGAAIKQIFEQVQIDTQGLLPDLDRPTVTKTRISGHARQSVTQQIVRVDRKSDQLPNPELQDQLAEYIQSQISQVDAVVCSDYGDGVFTSPVITAALNHPCTIVDAQQGLPRYRGATIFTPNLPEAEAAVGYDITNARLVQKAGQDLLELTKAKYMLITRGGDGMSLFGADGTEQHIPAFNRSEVFDVTGAGDTVAAALTLALVSGGTVWEAAVLGNLAASIVVRQFGTATTTTQEMEAALRDLLEEDE